jgi:hypothetical protein
MSKTIEIKSKKLSALNEALQKASNFNIKVVSNPLKEDSQFVSVLSTDDSFDSDILANDNVEVKEISTEKQQEKNKLTNEIIDKLNDTLKANKEIYNLLDKVKDINNSDDTNKWISNEENNTAILKKHNANIFIQNNNICLSHDGQIEIFKSVSELHDWLKANDYPIPHAIKLHEAKQKLMEFKILNDKGLADLIFNGNVPTTTVKTTDYKKPKADPDSWYLSYPTGNKGTVYRDDDYNPINYSGDKLYLRYDWQKYKHFKDILTDDIDLAAQFKSRKHAEALQIILYSRFIKNFVAIKPLDNSAYDICLQYVGSDYTNSTGDLPTYLPRDWHSSGVLFTTDLKKAAKFTTIVQAKNENEKVKKQYKNLDLFYKPVTIEKETNITECGVTTAGIGSAVAWTGNKKLKEEEELTEGGICFGFENTPFAKKTYYSTAERASEYLKWLFNSNENYTNLDPNFLENYTQAVTDFERKQRQSRANELWGSIYKSKYRKEHPMFSKVVDPVTGTIERNQKYYDTVKNVNDRYGLNLNPEEDVIGKNISKHNKAQRAKWIKEIFPKIYEPGEMVNNAELKKLKYNNDVNQNDPIYTSVKNLKNMYMSANNNPDMYGEKDINPDTITNYLTKIINKYKTELKDKKVYNQVIDKFIDANEEFPKDSTLDNAILDRLRALKDSKLLNIPNVELKEDDTPADFANANIDTNVDDIPDVDNINANSDVDLNNMLPDDQSAIGDIGTNTPDFGDININAGSSSGNDEYGPDEEEAMTAQPVEKYRVLDILVNSEDNNDIKVKVQSLTTGKIEEYDLSNIDI